MAGGTVLRKGLFQNRMIHDTGIKHFNIRVYGLVISDTGEVLLTDEFQLGQKMTKFPGGGLRFGEGPADCMLREALEEFGQEVEIVEHFYTTDFYQRSFFFPDHQLISIYYIIRFKMPVRVSGGKKSPVFHLMNCLFQ
jgi:ADP-ribose pyrophosphatase YjhB (NUDIX family)